MTIHVSDLKQINFHINDNGKLESTPKTLSALMGNDIHTIHIKYKNTLRSCQDSLLWVQPNTRMITITPKYRKQVLHNRVIIDLLKNLKEIGYDIKP